MNPSGYAYFVERPWRIDDLLLPHLVEVERPYRIVGKVQLSAIDYENFITDLLADRAFLEPYAAPGQEAEVWRCVLVRQRGREDGVLVVPAPGGFVAWAGYDSHLQ